MYYNEQNYNLIIRPTTIRDADILYFQTHTALLQDFCGSRYASQCQTGTLHKWKL